MILVPYDSELWTLYNGAYGNVCEDVKIVMGDIMDMEEDYEEGDDEIAYDNIWENLLHQATFYEAAYLVMPYLVKFFEKNEGNFERLFSLVSNVGLCLAEDIPYYTGMIDKSALKSYDSVYENYKDAVLNIQEKTKEFIKNYFDEIKAKGDYEKWEFSLSVMAILCDREAAYQLYMTDWEDGGRVRILCGQCGYDEECNYLDDEDFLKSIIPAPTVQWDEIKYDDTYVWFNSFLRNLGLEEAKLAPYVYGTYTCPKCGGKKTVIEFMKTELHKISKYRK